MIMGRHGRRSWRAACVGALACAALGPAAALAGTDAKLNVAVTTLTTHLDPMGFMANVNMRVSQNVLETLIRYDFKTNELKPGLALSWGRTQPTTLELKLREGVTCHNGEPFDAEDVAVMFGPERFQGDAAPGYKVARPMLSIITDVKALDSHTVRFETAKPDPLLEIRLASFMSEVPCADAYRAAENWERWGQAVVGTGPYKVAEVKPGELQRFERYDGYWGEPAPIGGYTLKVVPEMGARIAGLLAGEYDIITEITPDQFDTISRDPQAEVVGGPIRNVRSVVYDTRHPVLANPLVRRALNLAIDRDLIAETIFRGKTDVPLGFQMKSFGPMFIDDFKPAGYNPELAKALLKKAGYKGEEIKYWYLTDYYTGEVSTAQVLQQMWQQVGFNIRLELKENWDQVLTDDAIGERGIINDSNNAVYPDPIGQMFRNYGPGGYYPLRNWWTNDRFADWSDGLFSLDLDTRRNAVRHMLEIYELDAPGTYLNNLPMFYGKRRSVSWTPTDTPYMDFRSGSLGASSN